jgi:hypothetical protein
MSDLRQNSVEVKEIIVAWILRISPGNISYTIPDVAANLGHINTASYLDAWPDREVVVVWMLVRSHELFQFRRVVSNCTA